MDKTLGVTARDLGRYAADLLDRIERDGDNFVVMRHGRAVAFIGPLPEDYEPGSFSRVHVAPRYHAMADLTSRELKVQLADERRGEPSEDERRVLALIAAEAPYPWIPRSREEMLEDGIPRCDLEFRGWLERKGGGWAVTPLGRRAAELLTGVAR